jgi:F-type H+/Na+-transporting ATPase subunit alpha
VLPAIDVGKSVSRVGSAAQLPAYRSVAGPLKLGYAQFEELEAFSRFGSRLDEHTRGVLQHGERIRACLKQAQFQAASVLEQIMLLTALTSGQLDAIPLEKTSAAENALRDAVTQIPMHITEHFKGNGQVTGADREFVARAVAAALGPFKA